MLLSQTLTLPGINIYIYVFVDNKGIAPLTSLSTSQKMDRQKCLQIIWLSNPKDEALQVLAYAAWNLNRVVEVWDSGALVLSRRDAKIASQGLHNHLRAYQKLAVSHGVAGAFLFRMIPKHHYLWHTAYQTRQWRLNPAMFHNFEEESWLGRCKRVAVQCHGATMSHRIFQRYLICLALYLEDHRRRGYPRH